MRLLFCRTRWLTAVLSCCLGCSGLSEAWAEDWPQWRGPARNGVWAADGIVDELPDGQLPITWSVDIGPGYNGPTVADGRVFVMDRQMQPAQSERILCFDSQNGQLLWKHEYPVRYTISYTAGPRASVTIEGDRAWAVGAMGHVHCLQVATGQVLWDVKLTEAYDVQMPIWGIAASPLVFEDLVILQVAGGQGACIVAFEKSTGEEVWRALDEAAGYSSPVLIEQAGQDVLVCWTGESLSGLDPRSGRVHWAHPMLPTRMPIGIGTPAIDEGQIFVSSFYDGSLMVRADAAELKIERVWRALGKDEKKTGAAFATLGTGRTDQPGVYGVHAMIGTPIVQDGYIYAVDSYGEFRCLEAATGKRVWEDATAVPRNRWATIHMVRQAGRVWMFNESGELLLAELSPEGLRILDRCQLIQPTKEQLNRRDGVCWSHPAFAEQSVFARNDRQLVKASLAKE